MYAYWFTIIAVAIALTVIVADALYEKSNESICG